MSILAPKNDTLITMARLVYEQSELKDIVNASFSIAETGYIVVMHHDDDTGESHIHEIVTIPELLASFIGLNLELDLELNDEVTKGHRGGRNR